jgi:uncharacterized protein HemY
MAPVVQTLAGANLVASGSDEGFDYIQRALEMDPELPTAHHFLGILLAGRGLYREALGHLEKGFAAGIFFDAGVMAVAFAGLGQEDRITGVEAQLDEIGTTRYVSHFTRATIALARNDHEAALDSIEASRDQGEYESVIVMEVLDIFAPLRDHPRYRRHLELMGIPEGVVAGESS